MSTAPPTADLGHVLVTGGAGFIGSALSSLLAPQAASWTVLDSLHPQVHPDGVAPARLDPAAELVVGDVTQANTWDKLGDLRPDTVIHLAAETGTGQSLDEATRHANVNVVGTTQLTDWLGRIGHLPRHVLLTSSRAVYGEGAWSSANGTVSYPGQRTHRQLEAEQWDFLDLEGLPARADTTSPMPTSVYGATKLAQEHVLSAWANSRGVPLSIFRLQNVYGPGQSLTNSYTGIVALFSRLAREGRTIPVYEDGKIVRDFVFIDDVARALVAGLAEAPKDVRVLDVGAGVRTTILHLAHTISDFYRAPAPKINGLFRDGDVRHAVADIGRTVEALPWAPEVNLVQGVARLQEWIAGELEEAM
ncbi:NAD-dependent epimerase/dehydratase family protein [Oryzihumus leptocrescens]|uniref:dTDP-L-rhamnose 4-epimerase n=1 Tax=Oryzihumus leptocrescens TaxID=297536 RepID=A0A542ZI14_9MICO|nr:NAD-dependent epimerase/dehydratase family protein [Oryzihumus leptocrescens]TQL59981.1 dTDP-L-rhamnose 4-epimerase [Oryzihumus leptocrescens]